MSKECSFCGETFDSKKELHRHWDEHADELNSHQKDKMKKAKRRHREEKEARMAKRKQLAGYGLAAAVLIGFAGIVGAQLFSGGNGGGNGGSDLGVDLSDEPFQGNPEANVTVVEFGDYRCPVCKSFHEQVYNRPGNQPDLLNQYIETGKVKFYFVSFSFLDSNFPGDSSQTASVAAECAYNQGNDQFWEMHNAIYNNQGAESQDWATEEFMLQLFNQSVSNGDYGEFQQCLLNRETLDEVSSDRNKASQAGVSATPTIYVNGEKVQNWGYGSLSGKIESELNE